ncbi:MAG: hypothetical protein KBE23_20165 [Chloroflexi bacterium]|nr:hypothetical protein [Chloroflexota bacterium]
MANRPRLKVEDRLMAAQIAIDGVLNNPHLQDILAPFGYDAAAMAQARALYREAEDLTKEQAREYGDKAAAAEQLKSARDAADLAYKRTLKLARVAYKDNTDAQISLDLNGRRKTTIAGWQEQAEKFYEGILNDPALLADMARYTYDQTKLQSELDLVTAVRDAITNTNRESSQAVKATQTRDAKLKDLDTWLSDFRTVTAVALADTPRDLQMLGFD